MASLPTPSFRQACRRLLPSTPFRVINSLPRQTTPFSTIPHLAASLKQQRKQRLSQQSQHPQQSVVTSGGSRHYAQTSRGGPGAPRTRRDEVKVLPFLFIFAAGSGTFYLLVQKRAGQMPAVNQLPAPKKTGATWSKKDVSVIFVLGGPGVGKGTQCENLVRDYSFVHLSAGDLLRAEQDRQGSEFGDLIRSHIKDGKIVPMEVTIALLQNAMRDEMHRSGKSRFLIDGFPRQMDQAVKFEASVVESKFTLFFDADEDVMMKRLTERGKTSGRADDNPESIKKRFKTFKETSYPVVEYFSKQGKVVKVDATRSKEDVYADVKRELAERLNDDSSDTQQDQPQKLVATA